MVDNKSAYNAGIYDEHIVSVLPYYGEYHWQVIDLVRAMDLHAPKWLDTGCGTGTLASRVFEIIPDARFTLCDPSLRMLEEARAKLTGRDVRYYNVSSGELPFVDEFDIVTAIQCHHYCRPEEREQAVRSCFHALKENGVFAVFENVRMETVESDAIALKRWARFLEDHGNPPEDVQMHMGRRDVEVFPIKISEHVELLKKIGFRSVNLLWVSYLQAGLWAIK